MPRRRAVRVIGASLAAIAVPGVSPRMALGASACDNGCGADVRACPRIVNLGTAPPKCCGPSPARRYTCEGTPADPTCKDTCTAGIPCKSKRKDEAGCSHFECCKPPEFCPDGECVPNCALQGKRQCGKTCCEPGEKCKNGQCVGCDPGESSCETKGGGAHKCCGKNERCCFNNTTTACCGPDQTCKSAGVKTARCTCKPGTGKKCGSNCCPRDQPCCGGRECCEQSDCCSGKCCKGGETCCGSLQCCGAREWCFYRSSGTIFNVPTCKPTCAPGNRAGRQCCGTGYRPNRDETRCVPE